MGKMQFMGLEREDIYEMIYALLTAKGREDALFGSQKEAARRAFGSSLVGTAFPELWFEVPLWGKPWFDLHVLTARESLKADEVAGSSLPEEVKPLFRWFAGAEAVRKLALSWDVGKDDNPSPAVQLLVKNMPPSETFLTLAGGTSAAGAYRAFRQRAPQGWFTCYTGVFPGRKANFVRTENIPVEPLQEAYRAEPDLLGEHLCGVGVPAEVAVEVAARCRELIVPPFVPEFQFDVRPDGTVGETFAVSVYFCLPPGTAESPPLRLDNGGGEMMRRVQAWGLADDRWQRLVEMAHLRRLPGWLPNSVIFCYPAFLKLRWQKGVFLDAKAYIEAGVKFC
ncbi:hypothetical protein [Selenomonas sp. KH1T6]|uniref:hypothetical protein n=1 Tax=Selenomonas sp. KH1T6 TaxID=3158784 RepID=UPI0008A75660|nr:hypothetical protein SAMN05216583_12143 [Selenomonas ruminantium]